jgi:hypothetical protein
LPYYRWLEPLESLAAIKIDFCEVQEFRSKELIIMDVTEGLPGTTFFDAVIQQTLQQVKGVAVLLIQDE